MSTIVTRTVARLLFAPVLVIALAILVKGYATTGDGFSAGVVAGLGVLMQRAAFPPEVIEGTLFVRSAPRIALAGLAIALVVAFVPVAFGDALLTHRPGPGEDAVFIGTLELITAFAFDVGIFALVLGTVVGILSMLGDLAHEEGRS